MDQMSETKKKEQEKVEFDGFYLIEAEAHNGFKATIPARGFNLKSWMNFEKSLSMNISVKYRKVVETEYMKYHWSSYVSIIDESEIVVENTQKTTQNTTQKVQQPEKTKITKSAKSKKLAKTDRDIKDITSFMM
jgi:hypothetical protein